MNRREMLKSGTVAAAAGFLPFSEMIDGHPIDGEINKSLRILAIIGDADVSWETLDKIREHLSKVTNDEWLVLDLPKDVKVKEIKPLEADDAQDTIREE